MESYLMQWTAAVCLISCCFYGLRKYFSRGVCLSKARLDGKTVIITGANTGLGKETAIDLAKRGAKVIIACRSAERGEKALAQIKREAQTDLVFFKELDLASLASVRRFAASINASEERLDILINNAGVLTFTRMETQDGFELQIGVNHFGHFLLTNLLLDLIKRSAPSRIVVLSSRAYRRGNIHFEDINLKKNFKGRNGYDQSKLANLLFAMELHRRLLGTGVSVFAVHPGLVLTDLFRSITGKSILIRVLATPILLFMKTSWQGARTQIFCAVQEGIEHNSGRYFEDCKPVKVTLDSKCAERLWEFSDQLIQVKE